MKSQIVVRMEMLATHKWPDAPAHRGYLSNLHAHVFKFEGRADVSHLNRQIEFHDLRTLLHETVAKVAVYRIDGPATFGDMSCEQIGEVILKMMPQLSSIMVSEDGQCDAEVTRGIDRPTIITLCGSTKFKGGYQAAERKLEEQGYAVFSIGSFPQADNEDMAEEVKTMLDTLHKRKIDLSDSIYVINPGGYVGDSTRSEIEYAKSLVKAILSLEPLL